MSARVLHVSEKFSLPLDWITLRTVVYGGSGSGKSTFGAVVAEELARVNQRFCVIDLKGDYWGLKADAGGEREGIPVVIFGGDHADLPLEDGAGEFLGDLVAKLEQPCVLDLEHLSKGKQTRFLGQFFGALYHANREPLLLIADEAQRYAPQGRSMSPDSAICLGAFEDIVKLGRKHGVGVLAITQRGAGLNKEVSELCDVMIAFRTPGRIDLERVEEWLDANGFEMPMEANTSRGARAGAMRPTVVGFANGQALVASSHPGLEGFQTVQMRKRRTFDSSRTPRVGERIKPPKRLAQPELEQLQERMATAIERKKAEDPKELRAEMAKLKEELAKTHLAPPPAAAAPKTVEVPVLGKYAEKRLEHLLSALDVLKNRIGELNDQVSGTIRQVAAEIAAPLQHLHAPAPPSRTAVVRAPAAPAAALRRVSARATREDADVAGLAGGETAVLTALIQYPDGLRREQITTLTGYKRSTRDAYIYRLRNKGYVSEAGERVVATEKGRAALPHCEPLPTGDTLRLQMLERLPAGEAAVLKVLCRFHPQPVERDIISAESGFKRSTRDAYIHRLKNRQLVIESGGGVAASPMLFDQP